MRGRRHKLQVSTFPFLAVLLCAMGSLILVLLVMDRKAHKAAQARAQQQAAQLAEESARNAPPSSPPIGEGMKGGAEIERRNQQARKEWEQKRDALHEKLSSEQIELQLQMRKIREELQAIAARLHYEQDTTTQLCRKVQDERGRLQATEQLLRSLRTDAKARANQSQESSQALRRMTLDLLQMEQVLKDLKTAKQREQKTFSVVPYHGRRGENRRPLYVECTAGGVIFHPERKTMPISAFIPRSSDSASEVCAEVEQRISRQRQKMAGLPKIVDKTPYLLLLLRPSGVTTYHLFQRALRGLNPDFKLDFGYEFIDEDWVLDFPADDEVPSTQGWMIATKAPSRPAPVSTPPAAPPRTNPRPMAGAPMGGAGTAFSSGMRGFRASEGGGNGSWVKGDGSQNGSTSGTSRDPNQLASTQRQEGTPMQGPGTGETNAGVGGTGSNYRYGRGHPSAMPPMSRNDESGTVYPGEGGAQGGSLPALGGLFPQGGSNGGSRPGPGFPGDGPSGGTGTALPGLGPPQALTFGPGGDNGGGGTGQSGISGSGTLGSSTAGNCWTGGATGGPGNSGYAPGMGTSGDGRYVMASRNNGGGASGPGPGGGGGPSGTGSPGLPGTFGISGPSSGTSNNYGPNLGLPGSGGSPAAAQIGGGGGPSGQANGGGTTSGVIGSGSSFSGTSVPGSQVPPGNGGNGTNPIPQGVGSFSQGTAGSPSGSASAIGGVGNGQTAAGAPLPANGGQSSDAVVFVDPLTGQPTAPPRPVPPPDGGPTEESPQPQSDGNRGPPRIRVVPITSAVSGGGPSSGNEQSSAMDRFAPAPSLAPPPRRVTAPRPVWVHGGRDWTIYLECRAGDLVLYPAQQTFMLAQAVSEPAGNPLIKAIQKMIDRRQSSRRPGEPPFHPQVCLLVRPEHIRTFLTVYPALEALPVPKTRRNLDADDDVISIVTGAVP